MKPVHRVLVITLALLAATTSSVAAQDPPPEPVVVAGPAGDTQSGAGGGGLALELQGRLSVLSAFDLVGAPRLLPPVAIGLRLLDSRLYVGVGLIYSSARVKVCPDSGDCDTNADSEVFGVAPIVTFDLIRSGPAALYPLLTLSFARNNVVAIPGVDDDFAWGANIGIGVRGDLGPAVSIGTEWGWGFLRASDDAGPVSVHLMTHGFFGTISVATRIGL